eukprot:5735315-Amphidinium_carterae.5
MPSRRCRSRKRWRAISRPAQKPKVESTSPWGTPRSVEQTSRRLADLGHDTLRPANGVRTRSGFESLTDRQHAFGRVKLVEVSWERAWEVVSGWTSHGRDLYALLDELRPGVGRGPLRKAIAMVLHYAVQPTKGRSDESETSSRKFRLTATCGGRATSAVRLRTGVRGRTSEAPALGRGTVRAAEVPARGERWGSALLVAPGSDVALPAMGPIETAGAGDMAGICGPGPRRRTAMADSTSATDSAVR